MDFDFAMLAYALAIDPPIAIARSGLVFAIAFAFDTSIVFAFDALAALAHGRAGCAATRFAAPPHQFPADQP